jgi:hypothetical protein
MKFIAQYTPIYNILRLLSSRLAISLIPYSRGGYPYKSRSIINLRRVSSFSLDSFYKLGIILYRD